jgi:uncharacterized protein YuzE
VADLRVTYDKRLDVAYVYFGPIAAGEAHTQRTLTLATGTLVLDLDIGGRLLGLEAIGASAVLPASLLAQAIEPDPAPNSS